MYHVNLYEVKKGSHRSDAPFLAGLNMTLLSISKLKDNTVVVFPVYDYDVICEKVALLRNLLFGS